MDELNRLKYILHDIGYLEIYLKMYLPNTNKLDTTHNITEYIKGGAKNSPHLNCAKKSKQIAITTLIQIEQNRIEFDVLKITTWTVHYDKIHLKFPSQNSKKSFLN